MTDKPTRAWSDPLLLEVGRQVDLTPAVLRALGDLSAAIQEQIGGTGLVDVSGGGFILWRQQTDEEKAQREADAQRSREGHEKYLAKAAAEKEAMARMLGISVGELEERQAQAKHEAEQAVEATA